MKPKNLIIAICCTLLALLLVFLFPSYSYGAEITEQELTQLETNLTRLEQLNKQSREKAQNLQRTLDGLENKQEMLEKNCYALQGKLLTLQENSAKQENSLQTAKEYAEKLEQGQSKKALSEYALKAGSTQSIAGAAWGRYFRLGSRCCYIGVRIEYDWEDSEAGLWLSFLN